MKILQTVLISAAMTTSGTGFATDHAENPFGLVYGGAMTENVKAQVNIHPVRYRLNGLDIVANVYTPDAYAGFPRALNGMLTFKSLLEQREEQGIKDIQGKIPSYGSGNTDYYQLGIKRLAYLSQTPVEDNAKPLFDNFSPTVDYALKAHLFGYLFSRDNLPALERELVVVSTLSAFGDVNAQLRSHLRITQNMGVDAIQMQKIISTLQHSIGVDLANNAQRVLQDMH